MYIWTNGFEREFQDHSRSMYQRLKADLCPQGPPEPRLPARAVTLHTQLPTHPTPTPTMTQPISTSANPFGLTFRADWLTAWSSF